MCDDGHSRVVEVKPVRYLTISDDVDMSDPGSMLFNRAQGVTKLLQREGGGGRGGGGGDGKGRGGGGGVEDGK